MKYAIAVLISLFVLAAARADGGDDTLIYYLSRSDLVVLGTITSEPYGINHEPGVIHYGCEFKVAQVLKGDDKLKDTTIRVSIKRLEMSADDGNPLLKKDSRCILFLKSQGQDVPSWSTADFWFGVQYPSTTMASSLQRLAKVK
jgi:hypothetical protein